MRAGGVATAWLNGPGFALVLGIVAAIPVMAATAHALDIGWIPTSDDGVIVLRAFDVLSWHPPLVGQYTQGSHLIGESVYSPGPMLYWLLAVPAHLGADAVVVTMGSVNALAVVAAVVLAQRRGGNTLAFAAAVGLVLMCRTLPVEVPYEVWNPWATLFPLTLLFFVGWSVACGDHKLLPVLAMVSSYVVQGHLTYAPAVLSVLIVACGGLALRRRRGMGAPVRAWALAALVVTLVCWSGPIADQVHHRPGNLVQLTRLATDEHPTLGSARGLKATAHTLVGMPSWVLHGRTQLGRLDETVRASALVWLAAGLVLAALLGLLSVAWRRRSYDVVAALALGLLLCLSTLLVAASIPIGLVGFAAIGYVLVWTSPVGMWLWLTIGWSAWTLYGRGRIPAPRSSRALVTAGVAATALIALAVAVGRDYDAADRQPPGLKDYALMEPAVERVTATVAGSRGVLLDVPTNSVGILTFRSAIAYALRREGLSIFVTPRLVKELGTRYAPRPGGYDRVLRIRDADAPATPGSRPIVTLSGVTISVSPP